MSHQTSHQQMDKVDEGRKVYKNFWSLYSHQATNGSMMLNRNADEFEAQDRENISECLPDFTDFDVVDIGAGIGRFTTIFAERARSVIATDFIESFVDKNRERNANFGNVRFMVSDAVGLRLEPESIDLVFTNWLLMYLSDAEVVEFMQNAVRCLRPGGYIHLRESCSEPSTGRKSNSHTLHSTSSDSVNPTQYRFSSVYIQLFQNVRIVDEDGEVWKLDVEWATSVPTYIEVHSNWRQIHWLARKVKAKGESGYASNELLTRISVDWPQRQLEVDSVHDSIKRSWTDKIITPLLAQNKTPIIAPGSNVLLFNSRKAFGFGPHVNAHLLSENFHYNIWCIETNPWYYRTSLTKANAAKDKRVRYAWSSGLESALFTWNRSMPNAFGGILATEMLGEIANEKSVQKLAGLLADGSPLISIEMVNDGREKLKEKLALLSSHFKICSITDITRDAGSRIKEHFSQHGLELPSNASASWLLVYAMSINTECGGEREFDGA